MCEVRLRVVSWNAMTAIRDWASRLNVASCCFSRTAFGISSKIATAVGFSAASQSVIVKFPICLPEMLT